MKTGDLLGSQCVGLRFSADMIRSSRQPRTVFLGFLRTWGIRTRIHFPTIHIFDATILNQRRVPHKQPALVAGCGLTPCIKRRIDRRRNRLAMRQSRTGRWCLSASLVVLVAALSVPGVEASPVCGDGLVEPGETCEDGNSVCVPRSMMQTKCDSLS